MPQPEYIPDVETQLAVISKFLKEVKESNNQHRITDSQKRKVYLMTNVVESTEPEGLQKYPQDYKWKTTKSSGLYVTAGEEETKMEKELTLELDSMKRNLSEGNMEKMMNFGKNTTILVNY